MTIMVVGEVMLDKYSFGDVERISPEAPVPVLHITKEFSMLGGAGNVAKNLVALGNDVLLFSILGKDDAGNSIKVLCKKHGIKFSFISDGRPTIIKHRFIANGYNQQLLRVDYEEVKPIDKKYISSFNIDDTIKTIVISDYGKGLITKDLMKFLQKKFNGKIIVDPKPKNIEFYKNVFLIKPNLNEASKILNKNIINEDNAVGLAALEISKELNTNVVVTRGEKGATLITVDGKIFHIKGHDVPVHDVTGAGDTFVATLAHFIDKGDDLPKAVSLANKAAAISVTRLGASTVSLAELGVV